DRAAELLAAMEPDEAVDALRDLSADHRIELLRRMPPMAAMALRLLLGYSEDEAGGIMTSTLVVAKSKDTISKVVRRIEKARGHDVDLDAVAVVNEDGHLVGDVTLLTILLAFQDSPETRISSLLGDEDVVTVKPDASADEVAGQLVEARRLSLVVVDDEGAPIGRILADDVLDALVPAKGRFHFPKLLTGS
ncbi:MAG TPA: CBS domain-containing protein, partial [Acidimicrobiales bacterium]